LAGAVADQELEPAVFAESHRQVAGGLGGPGPGGVGGDPGEMYPSGGVFDDEQDVEPAQERGVDTSEVGRDDRFRLRSEELRPGRSGPVTGRVDPGGPEDLFHG